VYARATKGQFDADRHAFPQAASLYWHFVDLVWVVVYGVVYLANIGHFGFTL
jgi:cytochrome c oxidase subunit 3